MINDALKVFGKRYIKKAKRRFEDVLLRRYKQRLNDALKILW